MTSYLVEKKKHACAFKGAVEGVLYQWFLSDHDMSVLIILQKVRVKVMHEYFRDKD